MKRLGWLGLILLAAAGCESQDREHLDRIARKLADRVSASTEGTDDRLRAGWLAFRGNLDQLTLETRVSARLSWEKSLAGARIDVQAHDGIVELKGSVKDLA
jgi:osmotically-inducible protein OsmY